MRLPVYVVKTNNNTINLRCSLFPIDHSHIIIIYTKKAQMFYSSNASAGFNAVLEPVGLDRGDGKHLDGMTVFPFSRGKCFILDSTCVDSFTPSALALTLTECGSASRSAEVRKSLKYEGLCDRCIFQAIAIESSSVFGRDTDAFISKWSHLTTSISGERRKADFLRQRLSLALKQKYFVLFFYFFHGCIHLSIRLSLATVRGNAQSVAQAGRPSS